MTKTASQLLALSYSIVLPQIFPYDAFDTYYDKEPRQEYCLLLSSFNNLQAGRHAICTTKETSFLYSTEKTVYTFKDCFFYRTPADDEMSD